ncbi:hypothetical protein C9374_006689 [Naegleria lovaniensis]|uniref:Uncharacterized protein n=1 Tax=Naegleria lovaniensis TaxID=51637 RepID=A0AA88KGX4_NAELO|nr:uncharacterized protein C9374_006689 [Naegleria lovaniensis]KAG2379572.1 hypothetical protein C9374_006689 [Naegleria lovaniensis]
MVKHNKAEIGEVTVVSSNYVPSQRKTWNTVAGPMENDIVAKPNNTSEFSLQEDSLSSTAGFEKFLKLKANASQENVVEKPDHSNDEEMLIRENIILKREIDSFKVKLACQKEENFVLSASLFSSQEEVKKMKSIIKKKDLELKQQQEKLEAILSNCDSRPFVKVIPKSPQESIMKKEVDTLRNRLKNTEEKVDGLKAKKKELENHVELLTSQLQNERITNSYLQEQAKQAVTQMTEERDKTETFKDYYYYYSQNRENLEHGDLEEQFEQLLLAKQELESKLAKREEQLFDLTMKFEALRTDQVLNTTAISNK